MGAANEDEGVEDGYFAPDDDVTANKMVGELMAGDVLHTTPKHMAICGVAGALALALLVEGAQDATPYSTLLTGATPPPAPRLVRCWSSLIACFAQRVG
jgi:hypothetical protein